MAADKRNHTHLDYPVTVVMQQREMVNAGLWRCCANCINFSPATGCGLAVPPRHPPAEIAVHGCPAWDLDIPF